MSETTHAQSTESPANAVVTRCIEAYADAMKDAVEHRKHHYDAAKEAGRAFRQRMPPLSGHENIRDFIACVAQGILMDVISGSDGARLLYAAQVAHSAMTPAPHSRKSTSPTGSVLVPESKSELL
jgi:hypothetical protein